MDVKASKQLEGFVGPIESALEAALDERKELGLSVPDDFDAFATFYTHEDAAAHVFMWERPTMCLNVAPISKEYLKELDAFGLSQVMKYFDIVRNFVGCTEENAILHTIEHPIIALREFEAALRSRRSFEEHKKRLTELGTTWDEYRKYIRKNAKPVRETLKYLLPIMAEVFGRADLSSVRHELDHVDFFSAPLHDELLKMLGKATLLQQRLEVLKEDISEEYAATNMELLRMRSEVIPLIETRAHFFNHIEPGKWGSTDYDAVKKRVMDVFCRGYIECGLAEEILDKIVSACWAGGDMDRATSNYLFRTVNVQSGSLGATRYNGGSDGVNFSVVNKVLYKEIPAWKAQFAENALRAVEVFGDAYAEDPSRLVRGNKASSYEEFLELCRGS